MTALNAACYGALPFFAAGAGLPGKQPSEGTGEEVASAYRRAAPYLDASWQLVGGVGLWTFIGWFADRKFHTAPWLLVTGATLGMGIGFYLFFRALSAIGRKK